MVAYGIFLSKPKISIPTFFSENKSFADVPRKTLLIELV